MRYVILVSLMLAAALSLAGCSVKSAPPREPGELRILTSTFPMNLFTRNVVAGREGVVVSAMLAAGAGCPHDHVLTPSDMRKIADADVFVVNGLGLEEFLGSPVQRANPKIKVLDSSAGLAELMKLTPEEGGGSEEGHHHSGDINPHLFASPRMAAKIVRNIAAQLSEIDPAGAELYRKNAEAYAARIDALAKEFPPAGKTLARKIVTEHAVFDYFARDARLEIVAVVEEDPGQTPSGPEMMKIVDTIRASAAAAVFTEPQYSPKIADTIAAEAKVPVAQLDPVASGPEDAPMDYYETTMRRNFETLISVLGEKGK